MICELAFHQMGQLPRDGETEPYRSGQALAVGGALIGLEDAIVLVGRDTGPIIDNGEASTDSGLIGGDLDALTTRRWLRLFGANRSMGGRSRNCAATGGGPDARATGTELCAARFGVAPNRFRTSRRDTGRGRAGSPLLDADRVRRLGPVDRVPRRAPGSEMASAWLPVAGVLDGRPRPVSVFKGLAYCSPVDSARNSSVPDEEGELCPGPRSTS